MLLFMRKNMLCIVFCSFSPWKRDVQTWWLFIFAELSNADVLIKSWDLQALAWCHLSYSLQN